MGYGLVLSGGGVRGAAHVGVLRALFEEGLAPGMAAGTSAGAIVTGLLAAGASIREMEEAVLHLAREGKAYLDPDYRAMAELGPRLVSGGRISLQGLFKGDRLAAYFGELTKGRQLDEAVLPFVIPAVDLNSGDTVAFTNAETVRPLPHVRWAWEGWLDQAMMASASVPGVFVPRKMGEWRLVDGGVTDDLPVDLLRAAGGGRILAVDVGESYEGPGDDSVLEVLTHSFDLMARRLTECGLCGESPAYILRPPVEAAGGLLDMEAMPRLMEAGYGYARQRMGEIRAYLAQEAGAPPLSGTPFPGGRRRP